ncbi:MAG: hypothetical protein KU28_06750 [Sulfurovum sp. PC08-66]|nr:MAG: hypothetical protein KU28_06750 [Sulfurovum sp. PC08-66]
MKRVAISACLLGTLCKYDGQSNFDKDLVAYLERLDAQLIPFCPEDWAFGTPRPTMDLVQEDSLKVICNVTHRDLTTPIKTYVQNFFNDNPNLDLFIGKSRSPSCGVGSAKLYDSQKNLISNQYSGIMALEAQKREIITLDSQDFLKEHNEADG